MALFDFLKRKKEVEKARSASSGQAKEKKETKQEVKSQKVSDVKEKPAAKEKSEVRAKRTKDAKGFSYEVIREPHISEKSTILNGINKYVFKIYSGINKQEVAKSIEGIYGVDVVSVNLIKIPRKKRRLGKTEGFKKGYSKAVVTIKEGQKIDLF